MRTLRGALACLVVIAGALVMAPRMARADAKEEAKRHFRAGAQAYQEGRCDTAITEYLAAKALVKIPDLDFNLGQAYRCKGDREQAIDAYRAYLLAQPDGAAAEEARGHVVTLTMQITQANLEKQLAEERARARAQEDARAKAEAERAQLAQAQAAAAAALAAQAPPPRKPIYKRWWLWTTVAVVAVGAGLGVGLGLGLSNRAPSTTLGAVMPFK